MTPEVAQMAAQFLQRITLQPGEIEAYQAVMLELQADTRALKETPDGPADPDAGS